MGIRIHKVLGFGLTDVAVNRDLETIEDKRLNSYKAPWYQNIDIEAFYKWWMKNEENDQNKFYAELYLKDLKEGVIQSSTRRFGFYEDEGGLDNVLLFVAPSSMDEWYRYDNAIDYYEADGMEPKVQEIDRAIFPWEGYWDVSVTPPKRLDGDQLRSVMYYNQLIRDGMFDLAEKIKYKITDDIDISNVRPIIPPEIVALVKYLDVFTEERYIYEMKPLIYTYWS